MGEELLLVVVLVLTCHVLFRPFVPSLFMGEELVACRGRSVDLNALEEL